MVFPFNLLTQTGHFFTETDVILPPFSLFICKFIANKIFLDREIKSAKIFHRVLLNQDSRPFKRKHCFQSQWKIPWKMSVGAVESCNLIQINFHWSNGNWSPSINLKPIVLCIFFPSVVSLDLAIDGKIYIHYFLHSMQFKIWKLVGKKLSLQMRTKQTSFQCVQIVE